VIITHAILCDYVAFIWENGHFVLQVSVWNRKEDHYFSPFLFLPFLVPVSTIWEERALVGKQLSINAFPSEIGI